MTSTTDFITPDETSGALIAATKVDGVACYNRRAEHLGHVSDLMIDKQSGKVSYALMSFGGFLGIGESYHPLPWSMLRYDTEQGGFVVDVDTEKLKEAPHFGVDETPAWHKGYGQKVDSFWGLTPQGY